ncbi:MAG TPA: type IV secretion system protein VirD4 [Advenella kashmirensis]|uniref:Type IV secretion system protein VirD4 n=1 Tax=Advenella kashmirensis TaxID=310575 RepID=A0A356LNL1_9BURK|nr:type IV secretion system protein VirD4 [Advenella kashmirensis]
MTKKILIWLAILIVSFLLFAVIGQLVGSFVFVRFAKVPMDPGIFVLWDLYKHSQDGGILDLLQYKVAVGISVVITLAPVILGFATLFSRPKRELHGSARFARAGEIAKAGLLKDSHTEPDIIIGKYKNRYLRWAGKQFAFLAAPTRSGKGVGVVIPNCLHYRDSLVVFDPKLENFEITGGYRAAHGQQVFLFNPSTNNFTSHRWNPLSYIKRDRNFAPGGAFSIANILYPTSGKMEGNTRFFNEMAQKLFVGLCLYLIETEEDTGITPTLSAMLHLSTPSTGEPLADWVKKAVKDPELSRECKNNLLSYASNTGATASGIVSSFLAPLSVFSDPMVAAVTSGDDFDLRQVRRQRMTIYVGILPNDISRFSRLINLFFSQLISENTDQLPSQNAALKYQCLLLLDEFAALGRVDIIESGVAYIAGYNLRLLSIFQNLAQLNAMYGVDGARTLTTNFECQIIFTPRDNKDAQEYSEIIGTETFKSRSTSRSSGKSSSNSQSYSDQRRPVMLPQEVKTMPHEQCVINLSGMHTIYADKIFYYKDKVFMPRLGFAQPPVPRIDTAARINRPDAAAGSEQSGSLEIVPAKELDGMPLNTVANKEELMQSVIAGLCALDSPPQYLADLKQAVAKAWQDSGTRAFERVLGSV